MKIVVHNRLGQPQELEVTRIVVFDRVGNPVVLAVEVGEVILASTAEHQDFNALLEGLGLKRFVVCLDARERPIEGVRFDPIG